MRWVPRSEWFFHYIVSCTVLGVGMAHRRGQETRQEVRGKTVTAHRPENVTLSWLGRLLGVRDPTTQV